MHPLLAIPATAALVYRAWSRRSLTRGGLVAATATAVVHALHPWSVFFALLGVFFLGGVGVTKVKHNVKAHLTLSSTGAPGGESPRTHIQVLANSIVASLLILLHNQQLRTRATDTAVRECWPYGDDLLVIGIVSNYAAVAADTFSSELGILSHSHPRLITAWNLRTVPPGTNGGVTLVGTLAGYLGALTIALTSVILLPFCPVGSTPRIDKGDGMHRWESRTGWGWRARVLWVVAVTIWGGLGSLLDSFLGGWLQESVVDVRTGKVIEGVGGVKVPVHSPHNAKKDGSESRRVESGTGLLDNNAVNLLMATTMSVGAMLVASLVWNIPLQSIFPRYE